MRIIINLNGCVGAGQCVGAAPEVFDQDDDGLVVLLRPEPAAEDVEKVRIAAEICPARVIELEE